MHRSALLIAALMAMMTVSACALRRKPQRAPQPLFFQHTAALEIIPGLKLRAQTPLPAGFTPLGQRPPIWTRDGSHIVVIGAQNRHMTVLDFDSHTLKSAGVLAADFGPGAPGGVIVDAALDPDGRRLATAAISATGGGLEVNLRTLDAQGGQQRLADFDGQFSSANLAWVNRSSLALEIGGRFAADYAAGALPTTGRAPAETRLYLIDTAHPSRVRQVDPGCALSRFSVSPNGAYAVALGDRDAPAELITLRKPGCRALPQAGRWPVQLLAWAPDSRSFLYAADPPRAPMPAVFKYDLARGTSRMIAMSSRAAAYTDTGAVIALGSQVLTWRTIARNPNVPVPAEIAWFDPHVSRIDIKHLGRMSTPAMLARSTMEYSAAANKAAIELVVPSGVEALRELLIYSPAEGSAQQVGGGTVQGKVLFSWAPDGKEIAILDDGGQGAMLTILAVPSKAAPSKQRASLPSSASARGHASARGQEAETAPSASTAAER